jgi:hypothetical protein
MRKIGLILLVFVLLIGCVHVKTKDYVAQPPKSQEIFISEIFVFKDTKFSIWDNTIKEFGLPASAEGDLFKEIVPLYEQKLKEQLEKSGFKIIEQPTRDTLILKTKIGISPVSSSSMAAATATGAAATLPILGPLALPGILGGAIGGAIAPKIYKIKNIGVRLEVYFGEEMVSSFEISDQLSILMKKASVMKRIASRLSKAVKKKFL